MKNDNRMGNIYKWNGKHVAEKTLKNIRSVEPKKSEHDFYFMQHH